MMGIHDLLELNFKKMIESVNQLDQKQIHFNAEITASEMYLSKLSLVGL